MPNDFTVFTQAEIDRIEAQAWNDGYAAAQEHREEDNADASEEAYNEGYTDGYAAAQDRVIEMMLKNSARDRRAKLQVDVDPYGELVGN